MSDSFLSRSGIPIQEVYGHSESEKPGEFPFTRGVRKNMYRGRLWTMRQYAGFGSAEESNERYRYLLSQGTSGLSVAFDLPTQLGYDPDHPKAQGEVGKVGVSVSTIEEMRTLFHGIDPTRVSTSMTINATAATLLGFYVGVAEEKKCDRKLLRGTVQNDVLKEYVARGNFIYPPQGALRLITDMFSWCSEELPLWNPISISGYHIREAGSTAPQELAFTFANAIAYTESAISRGLPIDQFAGRLSFFFNVHNDFFEEIAKFRAARRIWAKLMKDRFKAKNEKSMMLRFHSQTAGSTLTAQQPYNNVVRVTLQALAAVLGGTQSLHTNSLDEALALPTEESARLALRTQQVIAHESHVSQTVDPLGGSYFIENLTNEIEKQTVDLLKRIEEKGGTVQCIEEGFIQNEILNSAYSDQQKMDRGEIKVVGMNCFEEDVETQVPLQKIRPELEKEAIQRIIAFRKKRNQKETDLVLSQLKQGAQSDVNLQELIYQAVIKEATLGEISDVLREVYGEYQEYSQF
ncbi:MAG: methylmalonyl-CoA mutase [Bdellovibrionaceae bacterium]|nr:methylmalonyl-CoA mutase [Pseudobdellovibrionaceae bacterium]|tara:strand:- start:358 stop:1917 length:1560 start_codon:yes stop_codon:yes gene_type:complete